MFFVPSWFRIFAAFPHGNVDDAAELHQSAGPQDQRPGLAMIANVMTPYRRNLHKLVAEGIPEFTLHSLITHWPAEFRWNIESA